MSVDYYSCDCCGDTRYEEYVIECESCGRNICNDCVVGIKDENEFFEVINNNGGYLPKENCPFCGGNEIHNDDLLDFVLSKLDITKDQLKEEYLQNKNE